MGIGPALKSINTYERHCDEIIQNKRINDVDIHEGTIKSEKQQIYSILNLAISGTNQWISLYILHIQRIFPWSTFSFTVLIVMFYQTSN